MLAYGAGQSAASAGDEPKTNASESKPAATDDAKKIRKLIPAAAAIKRQDMEKLATGKTARSSDIKDKSLTFVLLLDLKPKDGKEAKEQYQDLMKGAVDPTVIVQELYRGDRGIGNIILLRGPVTLIHADRITACTCKVDGDTAKGTVSFEVPKLCKGKVQYIARRKDDRWRIEEFIVPAYDIHIVRNAKGMWTSRVPEKDQPSGKQSTPAG